MACRGCAAPHPRAVADGRGDAGYGLVDLLLVIAIVAIVGAVVVAPLLVGVDRARALASTRYLAAQLGAARTQAVLRGSTVALRVDTGPSVAEVAFVADGNGNGVRRAEIETGLDELLGAPVQLRDRFAGVEFSTADPTTGGGARERGTVILSFTPLGTSVSGSLYVVGRDGSRFALRIAGTTGRVRAERLDVRVGDWVPLV